MTSNTPAKELIKVDFQTFIEMTHLNVNCLYRTLNGTNQKIDYLYNNLGKELIDITKLRQINDEMEQIQKECHEKFDALKKGLRELPLMAQFKVDQLDH
jgi:hypothetical protein